MDSNDPYEILGLSVGANQDDVKRAYRKMASQAHPDAGGDAEEFRRITWAYDRLKDIAETVEPVVCDEASCTAELTLEEQAFGCTKRVVVKVDGVPCRTCCGAGRAPDSPVGPCVQCLGTGKQTSMWGFNSKVRQCATCKGAGTVPLRPCKECSGKGRAAGEAEAWVQIPAGAEHGQELCFDGDFGGVRGRLFVRIVGLRHSRFDRSGDDLVTRSKIGVFDAIRGVRAAVAGLDGKLVEFDVQSGIQPNEHVVVSGGGIKNSQTGRTGDLRIVAVVEVPKKLSPRAARLVEELADELTRK